MKIQTIPVGATHFQYESPVFKIEGPFTSILEFASLKWKHSLGVLRFGRMRWGDHFVALTPDEPLPELAMTSESVSAVAVVTPKISKSAAIKPPKHEDSVIGRVWAICADLQKKGEFSRAAVLAYAKREKIPAGTASTQENRWRKFNNL